MKQKFFKILFTFIGAIFLMIRPSAAVTNFDTLAQQLRVMTGKQHVRVVYTRDAIGKSQDFPPSNDFSTDQVLVGFDSDSSKEDTLQSFMSNYQNPLITHNGSRIVYTRIRYGQPKIIAGDTLQTADSIYTYVVDWKIGATPRKVANGITGCLWFDSASNREFAMYSPLLGGGNVYKRDIDDTTSDTLALSGVHPTMQWLRVSKDGKVFSSCIGAYTAGAGVFQSVLAKNDSAVAELDGGCWPSMPYDNSYRIVMTTADHNVWNVQGPVGAGGQANPMNIGHFSQMRMASYSADIFLLVVNAVDGDNGTGDIRIVKTDSTLQNVLYAVSIVPPNDWTNNHYADLWQSDDPCSNCVSTLARHPPMTAQRAGRSSASAYEIFSLSGKRIASGEMPMKNGRINLPPGLYISVNRTDARTDRIFSFTK